MPIYNKLFVANWKENKTFAQGAADFTNFLTGIRTLPLANKEVVFCPPYPFLPLFKQEVGHQGLGDVIKIGSQDVSRFEQGAYTGEVSAKLLADLVTYTIIGHSERRKFFGEEPAAVNEKIALCQKYGITPIVCVSRKDEVARLVFDHSQTIFLAFEPLGAIGSKHPESLPTVTDFFNEIQSQVGTNVGFLYGGSVDEEDASSFTGSPLINGLLLGGASVGRPSFINIIQKS